jgi:hypothetical protein
MKSLRLYGGIIALVLIVAVGSVSYVHYKQHEAAKNQLSIELSSLQAVQRKIDANRDKVQALSDQYTDRVSDARNASHKRHDEMMTEDASRDQALELANIEVSSIEKSTSLNTQMMEKVDNFADQLSPVLGEDHVDKYRSLKRTWETDINMGLQHWYSAATDIQDNLKESKLGRFMSSNGDEISKQYSDSADYENKADVDAEAVSQESIRLRKELSDRIDATAKKLASI